MDIRKQVAELEELSLERLLGMADTFRYYLREYAQATKLVKDTMQKLHVVEIAIDKKLQQIYDEY